MHYAHRSTYIDHRASCIAYKSICKSRAMCISQIVAIGVSLACGDRLQSKSPANNFMRKLLTAAPYWQIPSRQYPMPSPRKIDATVIHTREIAAGCVNSGRKAPQKWEDMVTWTEALEAKIGSDFGLDPSNYW